VLHPCSSNEQEAWHAIEERPLLAVTG